MTTRRVLTTAVVAALTVSAAAPAAASAGCAAIPLGDQVSGSAVIATAEFLPGAGDATGTLQTPARARILSYDKGSGPAELDVSTGLGSRFFVSEGINPKAGETWRLYGSLSPNGSLGTSLCSGSLVMPAQPATASITAAGVTRQLAAANTSGRARSGTLATVKMPKRGTVTLKATSAGPDAAAAQSVAALLIGPSGVSKALRVSWTGRSGSVSGKLPKLSLGKKGATLVVITREASFAIRLRAAG